MQIVDFDPTRGQAFQGDVAIIPIPGGIAISTKDEIKPIGGKLILQQGELTGHHHHIALRQRNFKPARDIGNPVLNVHDTRLRRAFGGTRKAKAAQIASFMTATGARMFRDPAAVQVMATMPVRDLLGGMTPVLARTDLAVGILFVPAANEVVSHQEHDGICLLGGDGNIITPSAGYAFQAGRYYIGGQVESVGAEERRVAD